MVEISIDDGSRNLIVTVRGLHVLWTLRRRLEIPLGHIREVRRADPDIIERGWKGIRAPGTHVPGVIVAGTYYRRGEKHFWDVSDARRAIIMDLHGESYDRLIVEVADPEGTIAMIRKAMVTPGG